MPCVRPIKVTKKDFSSSLSLKTKSFISKHVNQLYMPLYEVRAECSFSFMPYLIPYSDIKLYLGLVHGVRVQSRRSCLRAVPFT